MKYRKRSKRRTLKEILDSDDELPTNYIEKPYVPAYLDDNRFKYLKEISRPNQEDKILENHTEKSNETQIINKGILSKKDTFCLQSVQQSIRSDTLLWLFMFMLYKDCQSKYKFLSSCLVPKYERDCSRFSGAPDIDIGNLNYKYKVVIENGH